MEYVQHFVVGCALAFAAMGIVTIVLSEGQGFLLGSIWSRGVLVLGGALGLVFEVGNYTNTIWTQTGHALVGVGAALVGALITGGFVTRALGSGWWRSPISRSLVIVGGAVIGLGFQLANFV